MNGSSAGAAASSATQVTQTHFEDWWKDRCRENIGIERPKDIARLAWQAAIAHSPEVAKLKQELREEIECRRKEQDRSEALDKECDDLLRRLSAASPSVSPAQPEKTKQFYCGNGMVIVSKITKGGFHALAFRNTPKTVGKPGELLENGLYPNPEVLVWFSNIESVRAVQDTLSAIVLEMHGVEVRGPFGSVKIRVEEPPNVDVESEAEARGTKGI